MPMRILLLFLIVFNSPLISHAQQHANTGQVLDATSDKPIPGALVTCGNNVSLTADDGRFTIPPAADNIKVRAHGYGRSETAALGAQTVRLHPFTPKALYLSHYGIGSKKLREAALRLADSREINALVIDIKGDRGLLAHKSSIPLASGVGVRRTITIPDLAGLVESLKKRGIYTIARIVVFKDNPLVTAKPQYAVRNASGDIWRDREHLAWSDPFRREVWEYNIAIAEEAAKNGFDEIQFDYVRFPDAPGGLHFSQPSSQSARIKAIGSFLSTARERLIPYNVFLSADIFGYVCWNRDDTHIGQRLEDLMESVDYLAPMLYPSGYHLGIPGYRNPVSHPYEIVSLSLKQAQKRTKLPSNRFRPWLQAFKDYAFDRRQFGAEAIRAQIKAAEDFGTDGWMLWNPRNVYSGEGLRNR